MLILPFQNTLKKNFPAEIMTGHAFVLPEPFLDRGLGADPGVIHSGQPQHFKPPHSSATDQNVLDRIIQHVPKSEDAGDVWRRHHDRERRLRRLSVSLKIALL